MSSKTYIPALKYDWLTKLYDPVVGTLMPERQFKSALIKQASLEPGSKVLDFGCGSLTLTIMAAKERPDVKLHGIDVDEQILSLAEKKLNQSGIELPLHHYDGHVLPFGDGYFDRIISSSVFHHLTKQQKQQAFSEIFRVLKPNGELHIADWGKASNLFMRGAFFAVQLLDGFKTTADNVKGYLRDYITRAGFKNAIETMTSKTILGTLSLYKTIKQNGYESTSVIL